MDDLTKSAFLNRPDLHVETEGEFRGWRTWSRDNFETLNGPFYHRMDDQGRIHCAFRVENKHLNGMRNVHGGCFMAFADYCLFAMAAPVLQGPGVTVSFACEFLDAAREGELVEGSGEIMRAGGSMIFLRGLLKSGERPLHIFRDPQAGEAANAASRRQRGQVAPPPFVQARFLYASRNLPRIASGAGFRPKTLYFFSSSSLRYFSTSRVTSC